MYDLIYSNPRDVAIAVAITLAVLGIVGGLAAYIRHRFRDALTTRGDLDDFVFDLARRTRLLLILFPAIYLGSRALTIPAESASAIRVAARISLIAQGAFWFAGVIDFALRRYRLRRIETDPSAITTISLFRYGAYIVLWAIALLVALDNLGVNVTALITGLGIGGVAIALATQNILGDLFASLSIVLDKPFVVGDFIRVGEDMGTVEKIGLKTTRLRALSGEQLIFSNGELLKSRIRNLRRMEERRVVFRIGVLYQTTADQLQRIPLMVRQAIEKNEQTRFDRGHFANFGDSAYEFEFVYFVLSADHALFMDLQQAINLDIVRAFESEGIEFAYPTRTVFLQRQR
jgi:small-conductance mechanosensitive channel